jgi:hypothetical protein
MLLPDPLMVSKVAVKKRYPPLWQVESSSPPEGIPLSRNDSNDNGTYAKESSTSNKCKHASFLEARNNTNSWNAFPSKFCHKAPIRPLSDIIRDSLSIGQEVALVSLILSLHHYILFLEQQQNDDLPQQLTVNNSWRSTSLFCLGLFTLIIITFYGEEEGSASSSTWMKNRTNRLHTRLPDAMLLSVLLRLLSSVLRTLTASYSSDTVIRLATSGMLVHLLACNYSYANGGVYLARQKQQQTNSQQPNSTVNTMPEEFSIKRPKFKGGTISLNASFFSVTLLASRFQSNALAFIFVSASVIAFAFYPDARHRMARRRHHHYSSWRVIGTNIPLLEMLIFLSLFLSAYIALLSTDSIMVAAKLYICVQGMVCIVGPCTMYYIQHYRLIIIGPWDIASISKNDDDDD